MLVEDEQMATVLTDAAKALGATIRTRRKEQLPSGWSQEALAARMVALGHPTWRQTTVAKVEAGRRPVSMAEGISLAYALGMPQIDLLYGAESQVQELLLGNFSARVQGRVQAAMDQALSVLNEHSPGAGDTLRPVMTEVQKIVWQSDPNDPETQNKIEELLSSALERKHDHGVDQEA